MNKNYIQILKKLESDSYNAIIALMKEKGLNTVELNDTEAYVYDDLGSGCDCEKIGSVELTELETLTLVSEEDARYTRTDCHPGTFPYIHAAVLRKVNEEKISLLMKPVEALGMMTRTVNALKECRITRIADLCMCSTRSMERVRGISRKTLKQMKETLRDKGLDMDLDLTYLSFMPRKDIVEHQWLIRRRKAE